MSTRERVIAIKIPFKTVVLILAAVLFAKAISLIAPLLMPLLLAILLAVATMPVVYWLERRGAKRSLAVGLTTALIAATILLIAYLIVPTVYDQIMAFITNFPQEKEKILSSIPKDSPLRTFIESSLHKNALNYDPKNFSQLLGAGNYVLAAATEVLIIFVFTIYLLADGPRMIEWISAFFSPLTRIKIQRTGHLSAKIISAYVFGQVITSALSFAFVFIVLSILHVPNVLLLASLAGLFDVLPVLGFILAVVPAMIFALDVSGSTPLIVFGAYLFYHGIENYFIVPLVYGRKLRVSSFLVFFGLLAAYSLTGIEGAIAILPIIASYPVIERIWLTKYVRASALIDHEDELPEPVEPVDPFEGDPVYR